MPVLPSFRFPRLFASLLTLLAVSSTAWGEPGTEESFIPRYSAGEARYLWSSEADFDDLPGSSIQMQEAGIRVPIPIIMNDKIRVVTGIRYRWNQFDINNFVPLQTKLDLHRLQVPIDVWYQISDKWKFWARAEPGIFSDFKDISSDDLSVSALALVAYQWNERLSLALGGYYSRDLGDDRLLPAVGAIWRPNKHWILSLTVPRVYASYSPSKKTAFSLFAYPGGGGWNIEDPDTGENRDLNYSNIRAGLGAETKITKNIWGFLESGYQFRQRLELEGDKERDLDGSWFVSGGIRLRF